MAIAFSAVAVVGEAHASWLSRVLREAGEAGGDIGRRSAGSLDEAAARLKRLPKNVRTGAVAASASAEGHWTFVNRTGQRFTAANPEEMGRLTAALFPDGVGPNGLNIYLDRSTVFGQHAVLDRLPRSSKLWVVAGKDAYPLRVGAVRSADGKQATGMYAVVRRHLWVPITNRIDFDETLWQLNRKIDRSRMRVLALAPDGPAALAKTRRRSPGTVDTLVDSVDPKHVVSALKDLRGQTAILTGRITGKNLDYRTAAGFEYSVDLAEVRRVAAAHDVNLIVLNARTPRQPGSRNWLWQTVGVDGLNDALQGRSMADFLERLTAANGQLRLYIRSRDGGRVTASVVAVDTTSPIPGSDTLGQVFAEIVSEVAGQVAAFSLELDLVDAKRQRELDQRLVPGIPSDVQFTVLALYILGLFGLPVARNWWRGIWPPEARSEYGGWFGYAAARAVRLLLFVLLFLPLVGLPASLWNLVLYVWRLLLLPWRIAQWVMGLATARGSAGS